MIKKENIGEELTTRQKLILKLISKKLYGEESFKNCLVNGSGISYLNSSGEIIEYKHYLILCIATIRNYFDGYFEESTISGMIAFMIYNWQMSLKHPIDFINDYIIKNIEQNVY